MVFMNSRNRRLTTLMTRITSKNKKLTATALTVTLGMGQLAASGFSASSVSRAQSPST